jgi:acetyl esterase/lipase
VLRDEGEAYASNLRQAGVSVTAVRFEGMIHDFVMLNALANTQAAHDAMVLTKQHAPRGVRQSKPRRSMRARSCVLMGRSPVRIGVERTSGRQGEYGESP